MSKELGEQYENIFGVPPLVQIRCPGRVNLIGEHIDYHGYGVLPMAIEASTIIVAGRTDNNTIRLVNLDKKYEEWSSEIPCGWSGASPPKWFDYILCGWKGILEHEKFEQFGFSFLVAGEIPPSSGLSSSSSLVCASALATLSLVVSNPFETIPKEKFASLCANSEPLIGTLSGGMDQAAEVLAIEGSALKIDFEPLQSRLIQLPDNALFVVAHSMTELNKAATSHYNERVIEGRIIAEILKLKFNICSSTYRLKEVQELSGKSILDILEVVETILPETATRTEVEQLIGKEKLEKCLTENTKNRNKKWRENFVTSFKLRPRGRHVFSEALRVNKFEEACANKNIQKMGELMNESHLSCSIDYECSCKELDEVCAKYRLAGAIGARLTGAGWGGCAVILFDAKDREKALELQPLFVSKPAAGIDVNYF